MEWRALTQDLLHFNSEKLSRRILRSGDGDSFDFAIIIGQSTSLRGLDDYEIIFFLTGGARG